MIGIRLLRSVKRNDICRSIRMLPQRKFSSKSEDDGKSGPVTKDNNLREMARKYRVFKDEESTVIYDVNEERLKYAQMLEEVEEINPFEGINLERGKRGVFDIEDLVHVLHMENAEDIFVASVPPEYKYVDYICITTTKSNRHMQALIQFVRRVYKQKRHKSDVVPRTEGGESKDWIALDLGNVALHVLSRKARQLYDLDSLWAVGPKFDDECNKRDPIVDMLEKHSLYLNNLQPAS